MPNWEAPVLENWKWSQVSKNGIDNIIDRCPVSIPIHVQSLGGDYIALLSLFRLLQQSFFGLLGPRRIVPSNHMSHYHYYYDDQLTSMIMSSHSMVVSACLGPLCPPSLCYVTHIVSGAESYPIKITYHRSTGRNRCQTATTTKGR